MHSSAHTQVNELLIFTGSENWRLTSGGLKAPTEYGAPTILYTAGHQSS